MPRRQNKQLPRGAAAVVAALLARKEPLQLLQIGANDGGGASTSNDPVQSLLKHTNVHAVLVEPNPPVFSLLRRNLRASLGADLDARVRTRNVAVCPAASAPLNTTFYVVREAFERDYPNAPHWAKFQVSSMLRANTERGVAISLEVAMGSRSLPKARAVALAPSYVRPVTVVCDTPSSLMAAAGLSSGAVDVLAVDVEGLDVEVVTAFAALAGFRPSLLTFESKLAAHESPRELARLVGSLEGLGYETSCRGRPPLPLCPGEDAFAWRRRLPLTNSSPRARASSGEASGPGTTPCTQEDGCCTRYPRFCGQCTWANGCCARHPRAEACVRTRSVAARAG